MADIAYCIYYGSHILLQLSITQIIFTRYINFLMGKSSCGDLIRFNEVKYLTDNCPLYAANMDLL